MTGTHAITRTKAAACGLLLAAACACGSCAHESGSAGYGQAAPRADSVTVALWRFDESAGTRVADSGPFRLDGSAGVDTRTDFGRAASARKFIRSLDSFVLVPYNPVFESRGSLTVESWVYLVDYGDYEDTPIAGRWSEDANLQSWLLGVIGRRLKPPVATLPSPGFHDGLVLQGPRGGIVFAFQPEEASAPRSFVSIQAVPLNVWTHVAVTFDGQVVKIYLDGKLDSQYATLGAIRRSLAPLLIGNYFDTRRLSTFAGDLRIDPGGDTNPYYALNGALDELRISNTARSDFPLAR